MEIKFTSSEAIGVGWEKMKNNFWFFVVLLIVACLVEVVPTGIANALKNKVVVLYVLFTLAAWVIQIIVKMGIVRISLDILDKGKSNLNTLFSCTSFFWKFFLGSLLYGLIVLGGLILFIVPGIIWAIKYQFFSYLIIDKNLSPMEAIKKSGEITMGNKGKLFWFGLLIALINIAGVLCFGIGLFVTIPTTMIATVYVYRKLIGESIVSEAIEMPADTAKV